MYIQYGSGLSAPDGWLNFDSSPTLRLQRLGIPDALNRRFGPIFPKGVRYGDIVKGLPVKAGSVQGVYASHVLEHLSREALQAALEQTYLMLRSGGIFRCIVPDLQERARRYLQKLAAGERSANDWFMGACHLGVKRRASSPLELARSLIGNSMHLWMWDEVSLAKALRDCGFTAVRRCHFGDADDQMFKLVEEESRFICMSETPAFEELAMEATKA